MGDTVTVGEYIVMASTGFESPAADRWTPPPSALRSTKPATRSQAEIPD